MKRKHSLRHFCAKCGGHRFRTVDKASGSYACRGCGAPRKG